VQLQGLMIKIGQTMGSRSDIMPDEYTQVLSRLQDRVPPRPVFRDAPLHRGPTRTLAGQCVRGVRP
jgi:hypothetical protein